MTEPLHMPMRDQLSCRAQQHASADALTSEAGALDSGRQEDSGSSSSSNGGFDCSEEHGPVMFELCKIPGDGSCLFRALAQGLHQVQTGNLLTEKELLRAGFDLRAEVCKEMVDRKDEIAPFITGIFDAYVEAMSLEGCWGGEPELAVAIHRLKRPIVVYKQVQSSLFGKSLEKVSVYGAEEYPGASPVCVLFSGSHYDTLVQVPATA